jgi:hypothetical protein
MFAAKDRKKTCSALQLEPNAAPLLFGSFGCGALLYLHGVASLWAVPCGSDFMVRLDALVVGAS